MWFSRLREIFRSMCKLGIFDACAIAINGRVENTHPRTADYPLTPTPRTTLWTTPRSTLRTTPTDYPQ